MTTTSNSQSNYFFAAAVFVLIAIFGVYWFFTRDFRFEVRDQRCLNCNVILISADSVRRDRMSVYGYKRETTPLIKEWAAKDATIFDNYFSAAYLTPISEAAVHTGMYPEVNGMVSFRHEIGSDVKTLAQRFKAAGYRTVATGTSPEFYAYDAIQKGFSRDFDEYEFTDSRIEMWRTPRWPVIRDALANRTKPLFLWIALGDAHSPFGAVAENLYADPKYDGPFAELSFFTNMQFYYDGWFYNPFDPDKQFEVLIFGGPNRQMHFANEKSIKPRKWPVKATPADMKYINDIYDNGINEMDREVGRVVRTVQALGLADRTVIVMQSEHGEDLGEHKYVAHYDIHDNHVHQPMIFASPALKGGKRSDIMVSGIDLLPSILDHVGIQPPPEVDGKSIFDASGNLGAGREEVFITRTPLWESLIKAKGDNAIFDRFRALDDQVGFKDHGIRTRTAKLIHRTSRLVEEQFSCWTFVSGKKIPREEFDFYDLVKDPGELNPVLPESAEAKAMQEKLKNWKAEIAKRARKTAISQQSVQDYR